MAVKVSCDAADSSASGSTHEALEFAMMCHSVSLPKSVSARCNLFGLLATFYGIICDFGAMLWGGPAIKAQMLFCRELAAGRIKIS